MFWEEDVILPEKPNFKLFRKNLKLGVDFSRSRWYYNQAVANDGPEQKTPANKFEKTWKKGLTSEKSCDNIWLTLEGNESDVYLVN